MKLLNLLLSTLLRAIVWCFRCIFVPYLYFLLAYAMCFCLFYFDVIFICDLHSIQTTRNWVAFWKRWVSLKWKEWKKSIFSRMMEQSSISNHQKVTTYTLFLVVLFYRHLISSDNIHILFICSANVCSCQHIRGQWTGRGEENGRLTAWYFKSIRPRING